MDWCCVSEPKAVITSYEFIYILVQIRPQKSVRIESSVGFISLQELLGL